GRKLDQSLPADLIEDENFRCHNPRGGRGGRAGEAPMCLLCQQLGLDLHKSDAAGFSFADTSSWAALPGGSGADAESPGSDTVPGSTGTSSTLSSGTSVRGYINSGGDQDWYAITLTAGQTYTFALSGFGVGALRDAYLRRLDSSG